MALVFPDGSYTNNNYPRPSVPGGQKPTGSTPRKPTDEGRKPVPPRQRPVGPSTKGQVPPSTKRQEPGTRAAAPKRPATPVAKAAGTRKEGARPVGRVTPKGAAKGSEVRKNPNRPEKPSDKYLKNRPENDKRVKAPPVSRTKAPGKGLRKG